MNPPSEKRPSNPDEVRTILAEKFPPGTRATGAELRETVAKLSYALGQPEKPGIYEDPSHPGLLWFSWFRPTWPLPPRKDGTYCSPIDKMQVTMTEGDWTMTEFWPLAHQGIKLLGAEDPQNDGYRLALVVAFLARIAGKEPLLDAHMGQAQVWLLGELVTWGRRLRAKMAALPQHISSNLSPEEQEESARRNPDVSGGPHRVFPEEADLEYIALVEQIGPEGRRLAANVRGKPLSQEEADTWAPWLPPDASGTALRHSWLVQVLWDDLVRPQLERAARNPLALVRPVFASPVFTPHIRPNIRETPDGQRVLPGLVEGGLDCRIIPQTDARLLNRIMAGLDKLGTLTGHRVLRWEIETGHRQFLDGLTRPGVDFRKIEVEGGYSAIAEMIGVTSGNDVKAIREIIAAQDATIFDFPWAHMGAGHDGRLLIREEIGAARGRKSRVNLILGTMLVPGYASDIKTPYVSAASRKLVPVTGLPPLVGSPEKHGPQVSLSMLLMLYLRDRAAELHEQGMVRLRPVDLQGMARQVGLTDDPGFLADLWRRWQGEDVKGSDPSAPAFVQVDGEHFTLSDHHAAARQAIIDAGAQEAAGRIRGQASQELRAKKQAGTLKRGK